MGANTSALLSEEIEEISREENLSEMQVKRLYNRFQKLDRKQSGTLDVNDLLMIPELAMNPLHPRLLAIFENVNFRDFVANVSPFGAAADPDAKADFAFRVYDVDEDGFISRDDLVKIMGMLVGEHMAPDMVDSIVQKVIDDADTDRDGRISREEFAGAVDVAGIASNLTFTF